MGAETLSMLQADGCSQSIESPIATEILPLSTRGGGKVNQFLIVR
jgi:hypothetical protein